MTPDQDIIGPLTKEQLEAYEKAVAKLQRHYDEHGPDMTIIAIQELSLILDAVKTAHAAGRKEGLEAAAKVADRSAERHAEIQAEHTGPHGEAGDDAMMAWAARINSEELAKEVRALITGETRNKAENQVETMTSRTLKGKD